MNRLAFASATISRLTFNRAIGITLMNFGHLQHWLEATLGAMGGVGLFAIGFLDSSIIPLPVINDVILIDLSVRYPDRMLYYALMSVIGSVLGCVALFLVAKKGRRSLFPKICGAAIGQDP